MNLSVKKVRVFDQHGNEVELMEGQPLPAGHSIRVGTMLMDTCHGQSQTAPDNIEAEQAQALADHLTWKDELRRTRIDADPAARAYEQMCSDLQRGCL